MNKKKPVQKGGGRGGTVRKRAPGDDGEEGAAEGFEVAARRLGDQQLQQLGHDVRHRAAERVEALHEQPRRKHGSRVVVVGAQHKPEHLQHPAGGQPGTHSGGARMRAASRPKPLPSARNMLFMLRRERCIGRLVSR